MSGTWVWRWFCFWKNWQYFWTIYQRIWDCSSWLDLQRIFFLLPNNVFLYRFEFLLTLPLVQRCINGSWRVVLFFCGIYYCQKFSNVKRNTDGTPEEHYLRACCWFGYIWETWMTITLKMMNITAWKGKNIWIRLLNVDYTTCLKTQIVILSL